MNDDGVIQPLELEEQTGERRKCYVLASSNKINILTITISTIAMVLATVSISQILGLKPENRTDTEKSSQINRDLDLIAHEILSFMIQKKVLGNSNSNTAKTRRKRNTPALVTSPVSAHKCIGTSQDTSSKLAEVPEFRRNHVLIHLKVTPFDKCEHSQGVRVTEEGFVLQHDGLYFVYSNINFKPDTQKSSSEFPYQTWFHYVNRESPNHPMNAGVLLRSAYTCYPNSSNRGETSYTGGIFYLNADDILRVSLSGEGIAQFNNQSSYLGLFMLASYRP
ncbi:unnamed protein product [Lymnaea stagnalis]|uniref:THD domain-containing protein n=1 Tax=Lymnaea stagnalis TaxID=6523 RepID=A0AAV2HPJ1_LYMST